MHINGGWMRPYRTAPLEVLGYVLRKLMHQGKNKTGKERIHERRKKGKYREHEGEQRYH